MLSLISRFALSAFATLSLAAAADLIGLSSIGDVRSFSRNADGITIQCAGRSQVQLQVLAPDLVRVRAAFGQSLPDHDHSWAIDKTNWQTPEWTVNEQPGSLLLQTAEIEVAVNRSPLLLEFRDAKTHRVINSDAVPMASDSTTGVIGAAKKFPLEEHYYGLGEKAARLDKRRGEYSMWNSDTPAYREGTDPIYQDIPFYIGWQNFGAYGIFFDNSYRTHFDFGANHQGYVAFTAEGGEMNYYFFWGPSIKKILGRYADLTGHMPMLPKWALGNQQSRWSYFPDTQAEEIVAKFRAEDLPLDVLHLDIHFMNAYRVFTWDPQRFPNPSAFTQALAKEGVKVVVIVDPGIKYQPPADGAADAPSNPELADQSRSYYIFNQGIKNNYFLKRSNGNLWIGKVWPGDSVYTDYTIDAAARWWGDSLRAYTDHGVAGFWNDMNEPSDFVDQTGKTQMDVVTYDGDTRSPYAKNRNVFALNEARATYEGLRRLRPNERPYIITRAAYAGIQRYSTMWTGDNTATWDSLSLAIPMFATLGLSGEPFVGSDIGGFIGRTNPELMTRWYEVGFLTPFCRNHAQIDSYDKEPWRFGAYYENIIRKYLKLRYRLLPFLYNTLEEAHRTGVPMFRPLMLNYQSDYNTLSIDDEFMVGDALLAAPILKPGESNRLVYLPAGANWVDFWTGKTLPGGAMIHAEAPLETVPLYVRAGSIIPMGPEMNYVDEKKGPVTFAIYPDTNGRAELSLYEDDGISQAFNSGVLRRTTVRYQSSEIELSAPTGTYQPAARSLVFEMHDSAASRRISLDGKTLPANHWNQTADTLHIEIPDDNLAHKIQIR